MAMHFAPLLSLLTLRLYNLLAGKLRCLYIHKAAQLVAIAVRYHLKALRLGSPPETGGACRNGSKCTLNSAGYIYCANCPAGYSLPL